MLGEFPPRGRDKLHPRPDDEETDPCAGHLVEDRPLIAQQGCPQDAHEDSDRGVSVGTMVPRIRQHRITMHPLSDSLGVAKEPLLRQNRDKSYDCCPKRGFLRNHPRGKEEVNRLSTLEQHRDTDAHQHGSYDQRSYRLILTISVAILSISRLACDTHKERHDNICTEVRERVYRISDQGSTMPHETHDELEERERYIDQGTD